MRDLRSRLRDVVRRDHGGGRAAPALHELTYVPDTGGLALDPAQAAEALGGSIIDAAHGHCIVIDRVWHTTDWHGRRAVGAFAPTADSPLGLFDARAAGADDWARRVVFFDLETTGLSGGAGTLPFLAGCGWFEDEGFRVRQFFLASPSGERAMLEALGRIFEDASLLVTYNGRTFDVPLMEMRWAFHRSEAATDDLPHFDMLPSARRLWGRRAVTGAADKGRGLAAGDASDRASCSLSALEQSVLGFHRLADVPGFEIPTRYFHFLRTGDAAAIEGVLEHNRHDLLSLAGVMAHAMWVAREGPDVCREPSEQFGLGRLFERAGQTDRAIRAFELAARDADREIRVHALARLATLLGREERHDEAAAAWQAVLDDGRRGRRPMSAIERRAAEALAIHHEHRARDLDAARRYTLTLQAEHDDRTRRDAAHRLGRIDRKMSAKGRLL
jgi:uncharacterized protein YprB with RNaseH-like and TPR domain